MMRCPLPIDWIEYLEGAGSSDLALHLTECRPCQILVDELRRDKRPSLRPTNQPAADSWPRWSEAKEAAPRFGELWWTASSLESSRELPKIPVLVLSETWLEEGHQWCEVVPLSTDIESATSLDLVMRRSETDMNVPWCVLMRYQTTAEISALESRIGRLTERGKALIADVVDGRIPADRTGSPIEGPQDSRGRLSEDLEPPFKLLGRRYARLHEGAEEQALVARVLRFPMRQVFFNESTLGQLSLAASTNVEHETKHWAVDVPLRGRLQGRVDHHFFDDELHFVIENVVEEQSGLGPTAWLAVWYVGLNEPVTSQPFDPKADRDVLIAKGLEVFPREITRLEFRLSDET
jgi:hypothetical protein